jgi:hypothetical protein
MPDPYQQERARTEIDIPGKYQGQLRQLFNIIEQWDGKTWCRVPDVIDRRPHHAEEIR